MNNRSDTFDLTEYLKLKQHVVNTILKDKFHYFRESSRHHTALLDAMQYSVEAGGKRLRPILCLAACEAVGGNPATAMDAACALEFIHTYSLIHDDLPAMDNDDLRRGKPTCHKVFGEATAILAGDALLTAAFEVIAHGAVGQPGIEKYLRTTQLMSNAAGALGMVQGQMLDLTLEGKEVSWEEAQHMHTLKTGALIKASLEIGAVLGDGTDDHILALGSYGHHIGLAFQVVDDILNVEGEEKMMGKPVGSDSALNKASAPAILGLNQSKAYAARLVDSALKDIQPFGEKGRPLAAMARFVIDRNK